MPELPEVEVVRRDLDPVVVGRTVVAVEVGRDRSVRREPSPGAYVDALVGREVAVHERNVDVVVDRVLVRAHLERAVQELSDVVYRQQQQIDAALAMNQRLRQQLEDIEGRTADPTAIEIPPHY